MIDKVFFKVFDSNLYTYGAVNPISALENLAATTLRNIVGELELDDTLTSRDTINGKMTAILDDATDKWGIKVHRVELRNIIPPAEIQNATLFQSSGLSRNCQFSNIFIPPLCLYLDCEGYFRYVLCTYTHLGKRQVQSKV